MPQDELKLDERERLRRLDEELVPLPVAATVAYFHITDAANQVTTQSDLADVVGLVAIALSTVAPILREDGGELSSSEVWAHLYEERRPKLDGLKIRRGDLRIAMITLREARTAFGPRR